MSIFRTPGLFGSTIFALGLLCAAPLHPAAAQDEDDALRSTVLVPCQADSVRGEADPTCLREEAYWSAQWAMQSAAARALASVNARFAAGDDELARLARQLQEARDQADATEADLLAVLAIPADQSPAASLATLRGMLEQQQAIISRLEQEIETGFPAYASLVNPQPLTVADTQALLGEDEALILVLPGETGTFTFIVTSDALDWHRSDMSRREVERAVDAIRLSMGVDGVLTANRALPGASYAFDRQTAHVLYRELVQPHAAALAGKQHLYFVAAGALTALPPSLLVTSPPEGDDYDPDAMRRTRWLLRDMAITVLPAPSSLLALTQRPPSQAQGMFMGVGNACTGWGIEGAAQPPAEFCGDPPVAAMSSPASEEREMPGRGAVERGAFLRNTQRAGNVSVLDPSELRSAMTYLPGTRTELLALAEALGARPEDDLLLARDATESGLRAHRDVLADRRLIVFATHGLVATDGIANLDEPGLVLTPPAIGSSADDGFLAASEIAADLVLDADFVILSACNTASPAKSGAESLSGLARAFFYAGARSLLVSHWPVDDAVAARITVATVANFDAAPQAGRAAALREALLPLLDSADRPDPYYWAPFVLVGQNRSGG